MTPHDTRYDQPDYDGTLRYTEFSEAADELIDFVLYTDKSGLPETVEVSKYRRERLHTDGLEEHFVESVTEMLHENYGDHDSYQDPEEPSDRLKAAARTFVRTLVQEYQPWSMTKVETTVVNVREWVRDNWSQESIWHYIAHAEATGDTDFSGFAVALPKNVR